MLELGPDEKAKYPFLTDAGQYLKDKGFPLVQFGTILILYHLLKKHFIGLKYPQKEEFTNLISLMVRHQNHMFLKEKFFHFLLQ